MTCSVSLETQVCDRTGQKGGFAPVAGIRLKRWGIRPHRYEFGLRAQERLKDFKQSSEMLRSAFLKDPIPVWRKVGQGEAEQKHSPCRTCIKQGSEEEKRKGHSRDMK